MAAPIEGVDNSSFSSNINAKINASKLFVIGAGGIGCELLKNLVLIGFKSISVVNLNLVCFVISK